MTHLDREATRDAARVKFRATYRAAINPRYSAWFHLGGMLFWGGGVIWLCVGQVARMGWVEWAVLGLTYLAYNLLAEYVMHRWAGHKKTKLLKFVYQRHTGDHHSFFDDAHMEYEGIMDWRVVLFPLALILTVTFAIAAPVGGLVWLVLGKSAAFATAAMILGGYLFYEIMHFSYHLPEGSVPERLFRLIPGWRHVKHLHVLHHNRDQMHDVNFNVTLPIFDILFNTLYWEPLDRFEAGKAQRLARETRRLNDA